MDDPVLPRAGSTLLTNTRVQPKHVIPSRIVVNTNADRAISMFANVHPWGFASRATEASSITIKVRVYATQKWKGTSQSVDATAMAIFRTVLNQALRNMAIS